MRLAMVVVLMVSGGVWAQPVQWLPYAAYRVVYRVEVTARVDDPVQQVNWRSGASGVVRLTRDDSMPTGTWASDQPLPAWQTYRGSVLYDEPNGCSLANMLS